MENLARWLKNKCGFWLIAAAAIAMMMISTTLDTTSRYAFNYPIAGVFELNEVLLVIAVFLTVCWTQEARRTHAGCLGDEKVFHAQRDQADTVCWIICFIFLALMGWQSAREALRSYEINEFRWGPCRCRSGGPRLRTAGVLAGLPPVGGGHWGEYPPA
jgi:TRAP-type C4-dicarboxylate transport system permease small subunit